MVALETRTIGADSILAVKGDQGNLHRKVQEAFAGLDAAPASTPHFVAESSGRGHGREAFRRVGTLDALAHLPEDILLAWAKCETLVRIGSEVERDGKVTHEERFHLGSLQGMDALLGFPVANDLGVHA
jgi:hypothetical protein